MTRVALVVASALALVAGFAGGAGSATSPATGCSTSPTLPAPPSDRPKYVLLVRVEDGLTRVSGTLRVSFRPEVATDRLVFRLRPNIPARVAKGARLTVTNITANGRGVPTALYAEEKLRARGARF
jgi:hypothetical protein